MAIINIPLIPPGTLMSKTKSILEELAGVLGETASAEFEVKRFVDSGYAPLNKRMSGSYTDGYPQGRIIEMFGPSMCGKTALATLAMKAAVDDGGFAMFHDHERSFDIGLARDGIGLDVESGRFVHIKPDTIEESFMRAMNTATKIREKNLIPEDKPIICVFDSLAAMVPQSKMSKELDAMTMADSLALAKATSTILPVLKIRCEKDNICAIILNQIRENPGQMMGDNTRTPGGKAPAFYADVRIKLRATPMREGDVKTGKVRPDLGSNVFAQIIKTKLTAPFQQAGWQFKFMPDGSGYFDIMSGLIEEACSVGIMEKAGSYIKFNGENKYKKDWMAELTPEDMTAALVASETPCE